jgi:hypothetical protein
MNLFNIMSNYIRKITSNRIFLKNLPKLNKIGFFLLGKKNYLNLKNKFKIKSIKKEISSINCDILSTT